MKNLKHTQGNWEVSKHGNNDSFGIYAEGSRNDLAIVKGGNEEGGEAEANSKLIASAPNLLKALQTIQSNLDTLKGMTANREQLISIYNLITESNKIAVDTLFK
jgi:hypothetical protein